MFLRALSFKPVKSAFDLYIGRPDYEHFVICHGRNKYLDEDFVICPQVVK